MKKIYKILIAMSLVIYISGCDNNLLDVKPVDKFTEANVFTDPAALELYVNGCYRGFYTYGYVNWWFAQQLGHFVSPLSDETYAKFDFWGTWTINYNGALDPSNLGCFQWKWGETYNIIKNCNLYLSNLEYANEISPEVVDRYTSEVMFIRAYLYFDLVRFWGGVPLVTEVPQLENFSITPRNPAEEVFKFINDELDKIISNNALPQSYQTCEESYKGRITMAAVHALKGRALLFAASPLFNPANDQNKWVAAAKACKDAIEYAESNGHALYPNYGDVFLTPFNQEVILSRAYWSNKVDLDSETKANMDTYYNSPSNGGWSSLCPTQQMVESYETLDGKKISDPTSGYKLERFWENRDPRLAQSILYDGAMWKGKEIETFLPGGIDSNEAPVGNWNYSVTGYFVKKFLKEDVTPADYDTKNGSPQHFIVFRLAELYLNYAETQIALGDESEARLYLNKVRTRSGMPPVNDSGNYLLERYRNERKVELFMENHRYHDLRRWNVARNVLDNMIIQGVEIRKNDDGTKSYWIENRQAVKFPEKYNLLPIPKDEIERSSNILTQNEGY